MPFDEIFHTQMSVPPLPGEQRKNTLQVRSTTEVICRWKAASDSSANRLHLNVLSQHADLEIKR